MMHGNTKIKKYFLSKISNDVFISIYLLYKGISVVADVNVGVNVLLWL